MLLLLCKRTGFPEKIAFVLFRYFSASLNPKKTAFAFLLKNFVTTPG